MFVLLWLMLREGRRTLVGLLSQTPSEERDLTKQWLTDFRKEMQPQVKAEQARLQQLWQRPVTIG